jgi:hypothetical protein
MFINRIILEKTINKWNINALKQKKIKNIKNFGYLFSIKDGIAMPNYFHAILSKYMCLLHVHNSNTTFYLIGQLFPPKSKKSKVNISIM